MPQATTNSVRGVDASYSGCSFKGTLGSKDYNELISLLKKCDLNSLNFPEVLDKGRAVTTLLVSYNEKFKRFKSTAVPHQAQKLVNFLINLGTTISLPKYEGPIDFEE